MVLHRPDRVFPPKACDDGLLAEEHQAVASQRTSLLAKQLEKKTVTIRRSSETYGGDEACLVS